jgi:hypothetical protein
VRYGLFSFFFGVKGFPVVFALAVPIWNLNKHRLIGSHWCGESVALQFEGASFARAFGYVSHCLNIFVKIKANEAPKRNT